ncbi:MAG: hypothetical protein HZC24_02860 [Rhodocyclales bacterium]|nr:hypothetical protein [Rhodocyclales bacterium]
MSRHALFGLAALSLAGCATMFPPSAEKMSSLPVVEFPATPPAGEFIFKLAKDKPVPARIVIEGTALASGAEQTLNATLPGDLYIYRNWISEDGKTWKPANEVIDVRIAISLPSDAHPKPGEIRVTVDKAKR